MTRRTTDEPLIFAPSESRALGLAASERSGITVAALEEREYSGGEFKLRPLQAVRDRTVFVVQSLAETQKAPIALRLIRLLFLIHGLRDAGASRVIAVIPYLAYARKDRRTKSRDPVYTRYVAQQLEAAGADRIVALDVHNASSIDNAFRIPVDHLSALPMMAAHYVQHLPHGKIAVVSPDIGGIKRAQLFRELLERKTATEVELVFIEKRRDGEVLSGGTIVGNPEGRAAIVLDDLCASGSTLIKAATALRAAGATSIHATVTHTPLEEGLAALAAADDIAQVVVTDSVGYQPKATSLGKRGKVKILPCGELLGCAMARMVSGDTLDVLAEHWPPPAT
ncbi:MAG: ribose-phosphate pyrophosphokinase [Proteobacteria bacterium]|nr:ribose-phosphate pyrophosphokinase [Pseudomonadota bacterium]